MNKIQVKGDEKIQRKRRTRAIAIPQLAASKISHKKSDYSRPPFATGRRITAASRSSESVPKENVSNVRLKLGDVRSSTP